MANSLFSIILALCQRFAGQIVLAFHLWRVVHHVVASPRRLVSAAAADTLDDFFWIDIDFDDGIQEYVGFHDRIGLRESSGKAIE